MYSVSSLEATIFREIISLVRVNFRSTFLSSYLTPYFDTLMGGNTCPLLPPIRVTKCGTKHGLRKVDLKLTLTNEIISRKIVVSRDETLYQAKQDSSEIFFEHFMPNALRAVKFLGKPGNFSNERCMYPTLPWEEKCAKQYWIWSINFNMIEIQISLSNLFKLLIINHHAVSHCVGCSFHF